ncbi:MAG: hypothetical protein JNM47_04130 [Hyphomonadaceae bacterium]|nr:hypothetical protein [Hyphomonadaceae bacterium]
MNENTGDRVAIVTVHGTGDTATGPDGDKWFQRGSAFTSRLVQRLASHGIVADIVPHMWSGANSAKGREAGSEALAKALNQTSKSYAGVHVIGHSHGGNVANDAATMMSWRRSKKRKKHKVDSITTVGTPFFKAELSASESLGGIIFLMISIVSVLALIVFGIALVALAIEQGQGFDAYLQQVTDAARAAGSNLTEKELMEQAAALAEQNRSIAASTRITLGLVAVSVIPLFFIFPIALQGLRRILRLRARKVGDAMLFSLWHPNDEAIAFLQRVERLPVQPFPKGSLWRGSRTAGIVWGVRAIIAVVIGGLVTWILGLSGMQAPSTWIDENGAQITLTAVGGWTMFGGLVGAPLIFSIAYALARLFGGLIPEWAFRGYLNGAIGGIVKGMAFGQDGDERIGKVSTSSHTYGVKEHILEGEVAMRMQTAAAESAGKLIERYRWALFTVGPDTNAALENLATDAMTWDSLIHTTYFDQPEVADVIADYIADEAKKARAEG